MSLKMEHRLAAASLRGLVVGLFLLGSNYCLLSGLAGRSQMACVSGPVHGESCCHHALPMGDRTQPPTQTSRCCMGWLLPSAAPSIALVKLDRSTVALVSESATVAEGLVVHGSADWVPWTIAPCPQLGPPLPARAPPLT